MAVNAEFVSIDFGLLLKEGQPSSASQRQQIPVVVARRLGLIEVLVAGLQVEIPRHVLLSRIDRSPIGVGIAVLGILHFPTAPVDRQTGVASLGVELNFFERGSLTSTVNLQQSRQLLCALWKPVERRHPSRLVLKGADVKRDISKNDAVLFPLSHDFGIKRVFLGIEVSEQFFDRLRNFVR